MQPPEKRRGKARSIATIIGGFIIILLLLATGSWYLVGFGRQTNSPLQPEGTTGPTPQEIPEEVPEEEAPKTPTPGFRDDFDDGLDPVWAVHYGDPFVENGQLTSNVGAGIAAGDPSWENYRVDFEVDASAAGCAFVDASNSVGVRVADFDHAYWFVFTSCAAGWSFFPGGIFQGELNLLPDTRVKLSTVSNHFTIKVEEATISAYENGSRLSSIKDSNFKTGGIFLQIEAQTFYDNFEVTLLP